MSTASRLTLGLGLLILFHAAYSAHEHSHLPSSLATSKSPAAFSPADITTASPFSTSLASYTTLPIDIVLEALVSLVLVCFAIVSGSEAFKPIVWAEWASEVEKREARDRAAGRPSTETSVLARTIKSFEVGRLRGYIDIIQKRKDFADLARAGKI